VVGSPATAQRGLEDLFSTIPTKTTRSTYNSCASANLWGTSEQLLLEVGTQAIRRYWPGAQGARERFS